MGRICRMNWEKRNSCGKARRKRPLGRPRRSWVNIKMDLSEVG
jgi:hypothetical protein